LGWGFPSGGRVPHEWWFHSNLAFGHHTRLSLPGTWSHCCSGTPLRASALHPCGKSRRRKSWTPQTVAGQRHIYFFSYWRFLYFVFFTATGILAVQTNTLGVLWYAVKKLLLRDLSTSPRAARRVTITLTCMHCSTK
jgi:hypothetical protein